MECFPALCRDGSGKQGESRVGRQGRKGSKRTLNTDVNVVLRLLSLSCILIGFGEGVCEGVMLVMRVMSHIWVCVRLEGTTTSKATSSSKSGSTRLR